MKNIIEQFQSVDDKSLYIKYISNICGKQNLGCKGLINNTYLISIRADITCISQEFRSIFVSYKIFSVYQCVFIIWRHIFIT